MIYDGAKSIGLYIVKCIFNNVLAQNTCELMDVLDMSRREVCLAEIRKELL